MPVLANLRILTLAALPLFGQTLENPASTVIFHAGSRSVRPIIGMTGASYLGPSLRASLEFASIAPDQNKAIIAANGQLKFTERVQNLDEDLSTIENAISAVDRIFWSSDSATAVLFSSTKQQLQWFTNKQAGPVTDLPENSRLLTIDRTGQTAVLAANGQLYRITPNEALSAIALFGKLTSAIFGRDERTLYVADSTTNEIIELRNDEGKYTQQTILGAAEGIADPVALLMQEEGATLYVAMKASRTVTAFRVADRSVRATVTLDWTPSAFETLSAQTFLLNPGAPANEPLSVLNMRNGLAESFIPTGDGK